MAKKIKYNAVIIAAIAVECFKRFGVHRTSMSDVADAAGISRQALYRIFPSRTELLQHIIAERITAAGDQIRPYFSTVPPLQEALIEGSVRSIAAGTSDPLLDEIIEHGGDHSIDQFLFHGSPQVQAMMHELWDPVIDRARMEGMLRPGISNSEVVDWIRNVHAMLRLRSDYSEADRTKILTFYLAHTLIRDSNIIDRIE